MRRSELPARGARDCGAQPPRSPRIRTVRVDPSRSCPPPGRAASARTSPADAANAPRRVWCRPPRTPARPARVARPARRRIASASGSGARQGQDPREQPRAKRLVRRDRPSHAKVVLGRASWKLTMTSRCKSGQRRYQGTSVAARRRSGRPGRRSAGSSPRQEGATHQSAASSEACRVVYHFTGSRARDLRAKAMDGVKNLECDPDEPCGVEGVEW